jgi:GNAT superfamily N-acetyltransferase
MSRKNAKRIENIEREGQLVLNNTLSKSKRELRLVEVLNNDFRGLFDEALDLIHYAGSCQRVGRCMRLAIINNQCWAGGIVLGSTFPNIDARDRYVGLKPFVTNCKLRGLKNPWSRDNREYWTRLQRIVNHARTFVFPSFQGKGIGTRGHKLLLREGVMLWEKKYEDKVAAIDTLCDHGDSKLFLANGWSLVGETKGYCSNPKSSFSHTEDENNPIKNNVGLAMHPNNRKWVVWVKMIDPTSIN